MSDAHDFVLQAKVKVEVPVRRMQTYPPKGGDVLPEVVEIGHGSSVLLWRDLKKQTEHGDSLSTSR